VIQFWPELRLHVRLVKNSVDVQVEAEFGSDLVSWAPRLVPIGVPLDHGDGTETLVFEDTRPFSACRFGRMRITLLSP